MIYNRIDRIDVELSVIGLGGHEYLADGRSRAFNEDASLAVRPGHIFEGFGQAGRRAVLAAAYEHGINFFDATVDSEKAQPERAAAARRCLCPDAPRGHGLHL